MRIRRLASVLLTLLAALVAFGCSGDAKPSSSSGGPASAVPASAPLYFELVVRPGREMSADINEVTRKIAGEPDLGRLITEAIEKESREDGRAIDWEQDVAPWLGERVGVFLTGFSGDFPGAVILPATDTSKAGAFISKMTEPNDVRRDYKGVEYVFDADDDTAAGMVEDNVVVGSEAGLKAVVDARDADKLAEREQFNDARDLVAEDALGFFYADLQSAIQALRAERGLSESQARSLEAVLEEREIRTIGAGLHVDSGSIRLDAGAAGKGPAGRGASLPIADLPADSALAIGLGDLGELGKAFVNGIDSSGSEALQIKKVLSQLSQQTGLSLDSDLFGWMGGAALFARGTGAADASGALIVESKDPATTRSTLAKIQQLLLLANIGATPISNPSVDAGFEVAIPDFALPVQIALKGDRFVIAVGADALADALAPAAKLGDTAAFKSATARLADGVEPGFFLDFPKVLNLLERYAGDNGDFNSAKPYLDALGPIVGGSTSKDDSALTQLVLEIK